MIKHSELLRKKIGFRKALLILLFVPFLGGWSLFGDPKIDVNCAINGYGSGKCTFTNTGDASGKECGKVVISKSYDSKKLYSDTYCSGDVEPSSSVAIDIFISDFKDYCVYSSSCAYSWEK